MMNSTVDEVARLIVETLGIPDRAGGLDASTELFGSLPELDSLAVVELAQALEDHFDLEIDDTEFTGEMFATVGSLAAYVDGKRADALAV